MIDGRKFEVPQSKMKPILKILQPYRVESEFVPAEEVFRRFGTGFGTPGSVWQGSRLKENLTQVQLAKKLGIAQNYLSDLETGRRKISVKMAEKLSNVLNIDYRVFL